METIRRVQRLSVIEVRYLIGSGVESDPAREVVTYYDDDGIVLAHRDRWLEEQLAALNVKTRDGTT